jgi:hypothetical protein
MNMDGPDALDWEFLLKPPFMEASHYMRMALHPSKIHLPYGCIGYMERR